MYRKHTATNAMKAEAAKEQKTKHKEKEEEEEEEEEEEANVNNIIINNNTKHTRLPAAQFEQAVEPAGEKVPAGQVP